MKPPRIREWSVFGLTGMPLALAALWGCAPNGLGPATAHTRAAQENLSTPSVSPTTTQNPSPYFVKEGKPFCFAGTNSYALLYQERGAVVDVLDTARDMSLRVVRMWAFLDRGSLDSKVPNIHGAGHKSGIYLQYWDTHRRAPAYNDGPNGLQRLDFVITEARKRGLNLTLVLTNNWQDFGGMDQYLVWYGLRQHHEFYTDERTKHAYQNYVRHIVERVNSIDGVPYKDDPTIFAWELANEPRTVNGTNFDSQQGWSEATISSWAQEMSTFIKSLDPNHMVAVGDEGFFSNESLDHWAYQAPYGVDGSRLTSLPDVDFGTYHLYPSHWGVDHSWGNDWIAQHIALSRRLDKPLVLEEYGMPVTREQRDSNFVISGWQERKRAYADWNELVLLGGGQAAMFWLLSGMEQRPQPYPDYDHFGVYRGDRTSSLLKGYATRMTTEATACRLANGELRRDPSPFVRAHRAPQIDKSASASPGRTSSPLGTEPSPGR